MPLNRIEAVASFDLLEWQVATLFEVNPPVLLFEESLMTPDQACCE